MDISYKTKLKSVLPKLFIVILFFSISLYTVKPACAASLSCSVTSAASCTGGTNTIVYRMSSSSNAHTELGSQSNYTGSVVCCSGLAGLSNSCSGSYAVVLRQSAATNGHVEEAGQSNANYNGHDICLSAPTPRSISIGYVNGTAGITGTACTDALYNTTLGSMSSVTTNAHVGGPADYARKICATVPPPVSGTLTSSVFDTGITSGSIGYNSIMWKGTLGAGSTGKVRFQLATSGSSTGPWNYYGGSTCGALDWFSTTGPDSPAELSCPSLWNNLRYFRYKVQICSNDCTSELTTSPTVDRVIVNWSP